MFVGDEWVEQIDFIATSGGAMPIFRTLPESTSCGHQGYYFGANYMDGICIDGYMWDADSCDEPGGPLTSGGDIPCPECNRAAFIESARDDVREKGYIAGYDGEPAVPPVEKWMEFGRAIWVRDWLKGYAEGEAEREVP